MFLLLIILIAHLFPSSIFTGQIIDSYGFPVSDVNIWLITNENNNSFGASSDNNGYFIFDNVENSEYVAIISHIEYLNQSVNIIFPKDNNMLAIELFT